MTADRPSNEVPRAAFAAVMSVATLAAFGTAWGVAEWLGADGATLRHVLIAMTLGLAATVIPILFRISREYWGVGVMLAGVGRLLVSLGYCYAVREQIADLLPRPLFVGVVSGAMVLLIVEAGAAVRILSAMDRRRGFTAADANDSYRKPA